MGPVCQFPCRFPVQTLRLRPGVGNPPPHPNPQLRQTGKFTPEPGCVGGASSYTLAAPPLTQCHLRRRSSSCPAPAPARAPSRCRVAGFPARSGLRAPARSGLVEWGGAAEAAPPTQGREWSARHPLNSRPRTQPSSSSRWPEAALWLHNLLDLALDLGKGRVVTCLRAKLPTWLS